MRIFDHMILDTIVLCVDNGRVKPDIVVTYLAIIDVNLRAICHTKKASSMHLILRVVDISEGYRAGPVIYERYGALICLTVLDLEAFHLDGDSLFDVKGGALVRIHLGDCRIWLGNLQVGSMPCQKG